MNTEICTTLSINLTESQNKKLHAYAALLLKWNQAINLISKKTEANIWERHILDCAQIVPHLQAAKTILDIGSGAGLPAIVLAILLPESEITACEKVQKKCDFMQTVKTELSLKNLKIENRPVEALVTADTQFNAVTARAVSDLEALLKMSKGLMSKNGQYVFLKGATASREISTAEDNFLHNYPMTILRHPSKVHSSGEVIILKPIAGV